MGGRKVIVKQSVTETELIICEFIPSKLIHW
jgi:hypothetical protein